MIQVQLAVASILVEVRRLGLVPIQVQTKVRATILGPPMDQRAPMMQGGPIEQGGRYQDIRLTRATAHMAQTLVQVPSQVHGRVQIEVKVTILSLQMNLRAPVVQGSLMDQAIQSLMTAASIR